MTEILVGLLVLSFGIIPIYYIFSSSRRTVVRSELSYLALQAARDRLEELRSMPAKALKDLSAMNLPFEPLVGGAFDRLLWAQQDAWQGAAAQQGAGVNTQGLQQPVFGYPKSASRILTRLQLRPLQRASVPILYQADVWVRWEETGPGQPQQKAQEEQKIVQGAKRRFTGHFATIIGVGGFSEGGVR